MRRPPAAQAIALHPALISTDSLRSSVRSDQRSAGRGLHKRAIFGICWEAFNNIRRAWTLLQFGVGVSRRASAGATRNAKNHGRAGRNDSCFLLDAQARSQSATNNICGAFVPKTTFFEDALRVFSIRGPISMSSFGFQGCTWEGESPCTSQPRDNLQ